MIFWPWACEAVVLWSSDPSAHISVPIVHICRITCLEASSGCWCRLHWRALLFCRVCVDFSSSLECANGARSSMSWNCACMTSWALMLIQFCCLMARAHGSGASIVPWFLHAAWRYTEYIEYTLLSSARSARRYISSQAHVLQHVISAREYRAHRFRWHAAPGAWFPKTRSFSNMCFLRARKTPLYTSLISGSREHALWKLLAWWRYTYHVTGLSCHV